MEILGLLEKIMNVDRLDKMASLASAAIVSLIFYFKISNNLVGIILVFIFVWGLCNFTFKIGISYYKLKETYDSFTNDELIILMEFIENNALKLYKTYYNITCSDEIEITVLYNRQMLDTLLAKKVLIEENDKYVINRNIYKYIKKQSKRWKILIKKVSKNKELNEIKLTVVEYQFILDEFVSCGTLATTLSDYSEYYIAKSLMHKEYMNEEMREDEKSYYLIRSAVYDYVERENDERERNRRFNELMEEDETNKDELPF